MEVVVDGLVFRTVIVLVPPVEISDALMVAFKRVLLTYSVVRSDPLHLTLELLLKFEPDTASVKPSLPAAILAGEIEVIAGDIAGAGGCGGEEELPPQLTREKTIPPRKASIMN